jgi:amino acid transporter
MAKTESSVKRVKRTVGTVKCAKCGFDSPSEGKFCPNCGARLVAASATLEKGFDSLAFLHFAGGAYLIITAVANSLVQTSLLFLIPYILVGVLGLVVGWQLWSRRLIRRWTKVLSLIVVIVGIAVTISVYVIGLGRLQGLIGPAWVIFGLNGWALMRDWRRL